MPPLIPPSRVHFPSNKRSKERSPSLDEDFSLSVGLTFWLIKMFEVAGSKGKLGLSSLRFEEREREKGRRERFALVERVLPIFNRKKLRGSLRGKYV